MNIYCKRAALLLALTPVAAHSSGLQAVAAPLSYGDTFDLAELRFGDPPTLSPDGGLLAYVVSGRAAKASAGTTPKATPDSAIGARIHLSSAPGVPICGGLGNQWHPSWSHDAKRLAFYSDAQGEAQLWLMERASGECKRVSAHQVRKSLLGGFQPIWAPDDLTIYIPLPAALDVAAGADASAASPAATLDLAPRVLRSGSEAPEGSSKPSGAEDERLRRYHHASWAAVDLAHGDVKVVVPSDVVPMPGLASLSPSGKWMAYTSPQYSIEENSHNYAKDLVATNLSSGARTKLATLPIRGATHFWHPQTDQLIYMFDGKIWIAEPDQDGTLKPRSLEFPGRGLVGGLALLTRDAKHVLVRLSTSGPDGKKGVFASEFGLLPLDGGPVRRFAMPDPAQWQYSGAISADSNVLWQPDARFIHLRFRSAQSGLQTVQRINLTTGEAKTVMSGQFNMSGVGASPDHKHVYMVYEDLATYPDVYRFDESLKNRKRVSHLDNRAAAVQTPEAHTLKALSPTSDGMLEEAEVLLLTPRGNKPPNGFPTVVMMYPGANLSHGINSFGGGEGNSMPNHVFTSRGYAVLMTNIDMPRGDTPGNPVQVISDQVLAQVMAAADSGLIDVSRLALSGQSYGGYATMAVASQTNLFRAGIAVNGISDLGSHAYRLGKADDSYWIRWAEDGQGQMGQSLWSDPLRYMINSPFYRLDRVHAPLLLLVGEKDNTVLKEESEKVFVGLRRLGKPAELAIYPGQGHVIRDWVPSSAGDAAKRAVEFLDRHLK